jgi:DNA-binding Lrp family transcriptional regulator
MMSLANLWSSSAMADKSAKDIQRAIVGVTTSEGNLTVQEIARRVGLRPHMVRYHLDQLVASKRVLRACDVNLRVFGFQGINIFFDLPRAAAKRGIEFLREQTEVSWLAQNAGPRKYEVTFFLRDPREYSQLLTSLGAQVGTHFRDPIVTIESEWRHWGLRFLSERKQTKPLVHLRSPTEIQELDSVDFKILNFVARKLGASARDIAREIGIAQSTLTYRMERLREWGALSEDLFFSSINHDFVQAQLVINLKARSREAEQLVIETCSNEPYVEGLLTGIGCWDFKIVIRADTVSRLLEVEDSILAALARVVARSTTYIRNRLLLERAG